MSKNKQINQKGKNTNANTHMKISLANRYMQI